MRGVVHLVALARLRVPRLVEETEERLRARFRGRSRRERRSLRSKKERRSDRRMAASAAKRGRLKLRRDVPLHANGKCNVFGEASVDRRVIARILLLHAHGPLFPRVIVKLVVHAWEVP